MAEPVGTGNKVRLATLWLDGCSGCHMSLLDMDERLIALAGRVEVVFSPLVDAKEFPEGVDLAVVEGAVSSDEDEEKIRIVRARSKVLLALGDCALTGNVSAMRNVFTVADVLERAYIENADISSGPPERGVDDLDDPGQVDEPLVHVEEGHVAAGAAVEPEGGDTDLSHCAPPSSA